MARSRRPFPEKKSTRKTRGQRKNQVGFAGQSSGKRRRKRNRSDADYVASAAKLAPLVPSLRPLAKRKKLKAAEKSAITRKENILKGVPNIFPVSRQQARRLRGQTFATGVQGIQLRGVSPDAKIRFKGKNIYVEDNGRKWLYWHLDRHTVRTRTGMREAGRKAFLQQFPIEQITDLAARAFKTKNVVQVNLWAHAGIVGDAHETLEQFVLWVNEKWSAGRYLRVDLQGGNSDPGKWVNGIAILLEDEEYARRRAEKLEATKNVLSDMQKLGLQARERERKRLAAKGLLDVLGTPLPKPKRRKKRVTKTAKRISAAKRKTPNAARGNARGKPARLGKGGTKAKKSKAQKRPTPRGKRK